MNRLDRLLTAAKAAARSGKELGLAIIESDGGFWRACAHMYGRGINSVEINTTTHATQEAAVDYIHGLAREYPGQQDTPIIIIDL